MTAAEKPKQVARRRRPGPKIKDSSNLLTNTRSLEFRLQWPTEHGVVTQDFGDRPEFYKRFGLPGHEGLDIRAPHGSKIFACAPGEIKDVFTDTSKPYGIHVRIQHDDGYETIYAHLHEARVAKGQTVAAGELIGLADNTGNSQGSHLHLTLKRKGATAAGETTYPHDIIDPTPYMLPFGEALPRREQPNHPLRGLSGEGSANWMLQNGVRGWAVEPLYSEGNLANAKPVDYSAHAAAGIRVLVQWGYSRARDEGGLGTFPARERYNEFADWCRRSIKESRGVWGHIIGKNPNQAAARPDYQGPASPGTPIMPEDVVYIYNQIWRYLPKDVKASPPAIDPTNIETMDPREYWEKVLKDIKGAECLALHAYAYGTSQPVHSKALFDPPLNWQYRSFRMWEPLAAVVRKIPRFKTVPLLITETHHQVTTDNRQAWDADAAWWVRDVYAFVYGWNRLPGGQYVHAVCLHQLRGQRWALEAQPALLQTLRESGEQAM